MEIFARYNICTIIYGRKHADIITLHIEKTMYFVYVLCVIMSQIYPLLLCRTKKKKVNKRLFFRLNNNCFLEKR